MSTAVIVGTDTSTKAKSLKGDEKRILKDQEEKKNTVIKYMNQSNRFAFSYWVFKIMFDSWHNKFNMIWCYSKRI